MDLKIPDFVMRNENLTPLTKIVYSIIAARGGGRITGVEMAEAANATERSIKRAIKTLEREKLIAVIRVHFDTNFYRLLKE